MLRIARELVCRGKRGEQTTKRTIRIGRPARAALPYVDTVVLQHRFLDEHQVSVALQTFNRPVKRDEQLLVLQVQHERIVFRILDLPFRAYSFEHLSHVLSTRPA